MRHITNKNSSTQIQTLTEQDIIFEFMLNALRLKDGFTKQQFELHTGLSIEKINEPLQALITEGLLVMDNERIHCSGRGYGFLDDVVQSWLPQTTST